MFKSRYVRGKAPRSRVNIVCRRESFLLWHQVYQKMLEGKLHVQRVNMLDCDVFPLFRIQQGKLQRTKSLQGLCGRKAPACPMLAIAIWLKWGEIFQCVREGWNNFLELFMQQGKLQFVQAGKLQSLVRWRSLHGKDIYIMFRKESSTMRNIRRDICYDSSI